MKALSSVLLVLAISVATVIPSGAAGDKQLTNVSGDVTYQLGTAAAAAGRATRFRRARGQRVRNAPARTRKPRSRFPTVRS